MTTAAREAVAAAIAGEPPDEPAAPEPVVAPVVGVCPECQTPMPASHVLCVHCGFNREAGVRVRQAQIPKPPRPENELVASIVRENPVAWMAAAVVGAAAGGVIWYIIMVSTGLQLSIFGLGLGCTTGLPVLLVAKRRAGMATGLTAGAVALLAVLLTTYLGYKQLARDEIESEYVSKVHFTLEDAKQHYEYQFARELDAAGKLKWDNPNHPSIDEIEHVQDLPKSALLAADKEWDAQTVEWQEALRASDEAGIRQAMRDAGEEIAERAATREMTELHSPRGGSIGLGAKGMLISLLWPYAMPALAAYFAYGFASGRFASYSG